MRVNCLGLNRNGFFAVPTPAYFTENSGEVDTLGKLSNRV
jgi:hypothetical protein